MTRKLLRHNLDSSLPELKRQRTITTSGIIHVQLVAILFYVTIVAAKQKSEPFTHQHCFFRHHVPSTGKEATLSQFKLDQLLLTKQTKGWEENEGTVQVFDNFAIASQQSLMKKVTSTIVPLQAYVRYTLLSPSTSTSYFPSVDFNVGSIVFHFFSRVITAYTLLCHCYFSQFDFLDLLAPDPNPNTNRHSKRAT